MLKHLLGALALAYGACVFADSDSSNVVSSEEQAAYEHLLALLEEETRIATRTHLNADHVPGIVSVLDGAQLEARGIQNVWEALGLVPGIELSMEETGRRQVLVRGIGHTYASGNLKLMLDGVAMNSAFMALATPLLEMPVTQVERIEIIRGPGSAVHGEFAYAGVVNIVPRREGARLYGAHGRYNSYTAGLLFGGGDDELHGSLNIASAGTDGSRLGVERDRFGEDGYAPGPINDLRVYRAALFSLGSGTTRLTGGIVREGHGDHFGINNALPPPERRAVHSEEIQHLQAEQQLSASRTVNIQLRAGWQASEEEADARFASSTAEGDLTVDTRYRETKVHGGVELTWKSRGRHTLLTSVDYSRVKVTRAEGFVNRTVTTSSGEELTPEDNWHLVAEGTRRTVIAAALQDEFRASERLTLTSGVRYDDYDDIGSRVTPRIAAVWRHTPQHIIKAQYGEAFRPPTFNELGVANWTGAPLTTTRVITRELGYIHRAPLRTGRLTLFHSTLEDPVWFEGGQYVNTNTTSQGVELEWEYRLGQRWRLDGNLSYIETEQAATGAPLAGTSDWLGNLGLFYRPTPRSVLNAQLTYVGDRHRDINDSREPLAGYHTLDLTVSLFDRFVRGFDLRAGVKNVTDETVTFPAPARTYVDDYPQPGRTWWGQISYSF